MEFIDVGAGGGGGGGFVGGGGGKEGGGGAGGTDLCEGTGVTGCTSNPGAGTGTGNVTFTYMALPISKEQCKRGGWKSYGPIFKNQGQCASFVVHGEHAKRHRHHRHARHHRGTGPTGATGPTRPAAPTERSGATGAIGPTGATGPGNTVKPAYPTSNPALCLKGRLGYPGVLLTQEGTAFKNFVHCLVYAGAGGQLVGVDAVAEPASGGFLNASYSGFGLKPNSRMFLGARYQPSGVSEGNGFVQVGGNGEFSVSLTLTCEYPPFGTVGALDLEAETAAGTVFLREFPGPTGC
jgi:hypothetical protein